MTNLNLVSSAEAKAHNDALSKKVALGKETTDMLSGGMLLNLDQYQGDLFGVIDCFKVLDLSDEQKRMIKKAHKRIAEALEILSDLTHMSEDGNRLWTE